MVIFAKTQGLISVARPIVEGLRQNGMLLSDKVMNQALRRLESSQWSRCARTRTARSLCPNVLRNASYGVWVEREGAVRLRQVSANDLAACYQENFLSFEFLRVLWSINTAPTENQRKSSESVLTRLRRELKRADLSQKERDLLRSQATSIENSLELTDLANTGRSRPRYRRALRFGLPDRDTLL